MLRLVWQHRVFRSRESEGRNIQKFREPTGSALSIGWRMYWKEFKNHIQLDSYKMETLKLSSKSEHYACVNCKWYRKWYRKWNQTIQMTHQKPHQKLHTSHQLGAAEQVGNKLENGSWIMTEYPDTMENFSQRGCRCVAKDMQAF